MNRVLRAIGAAVLGFGAMLVMASTPSAAATYTLNFAGSAYNVGGAFVAFGAADGDPITGTLTIDPFNASPDGVWAPASTTYSQTHATFSFSFSNPGTSLTVTKSFAGSITSDGGGSHHELTFAFADPTSGSLNLDFFMTPGAFSLSSLASLPSTASGIVALLGGSGSASGTFQVGANSSDSISFHVDVAPPPVAPAPIPPALLLFVSALGGLGFAGWRRRGKAGTA